MAELYDVDGHATLSEGAQELADSDPDRFEDLNITAETLLGFATKAITGDADIERATIAVALQVSYMVAKGLGLATGSGDLVSTYLKRERRGTQEKEFAESRAVSEAGLQIGVDPVARAMANAIGHDWSAVESVRSVR